MPRPHRPLDHRVYYPCDYLVHPHAFGSLTQQAEWTMPAGGDQRSLRVAQVLHEMARRVAERNDRHDAALVCRQFGFSKQQWSRCLHGQQWMGETVLAAINWLLDQPLSPKGARAGSRSPARAEIRRQPPTPGASSDR